MDEFGGKDYPFYGQLEEIIILEDSKFSIVVVLLQNLPWHGVLNIVR